MENFKAEVIQIDEKTWRIEDAGVRFFLLEGENESLMVDCGMMCKNALEIAKELTKLPVKLIITHADMDHLGSIAEFDSLYMNPAEGTNFYGQERNIEVIPVENGDVLDIGGRPLKIVSIPGHTPGSIALIDVNRRVLYSGDSVMNGDIFMFGPHREIRMFLLSLKKLDGLKDQFDVIYPCHGLFPVYPDLIMKLHEGATKVLNKELPYENSEFFGTPVKRYDTGAAPILMSAE